MKYEKLFTKYKFTKSELDVIYSLFKVREEELEQYVDAKNDIEKIVFFQIVAMMVRKLCQNTQS